MTAFWVALAVLACAATAAVIWPLLRTPRGGPAAAPHAGESTLAADDAKRLAVYRDRRHEIDTEAQAGRLSPEEAQRAQAELVAEVADHFPADGPAPVTAVGRSASAGKPWLLVTGLALAIPLVAALVYDRVGAPGVVALDPFELRGEMDPARLDAAIADLRERATRAATDGEAWAMLAEALRMKGDLAGSAEAFAKAAQHFSPPSARLLADYADVLVSLKGGEFGPEPVALLTRALAIDPRDPKSLALMGAAQYRNGDLKSALTTLRTLRDLLPPDSGQAGAIGEAIGRIETTLGVAAAPGGATGAGSAAGGPTAPAAPAASAASAASAAPAAPAAPNAPNAPNAPIASAPGGPVAAGRIEIDPSLANRLPPGTVLFVSARLAEGPRMPLAARRLTPQQLPITFELSDADAMNPASKPSQAGPLIIEARLSASGNAIRASGDLFGVSAAGPPGRRDLAIRIDQVVP